MRENKGQTAHYNDMSYFVVLHSKFGTQLGTCSIVVVNSFA
jgi:hypothetical protein